MFRTRYTVVLLSCRDVSRRLRETASLQTAVLKEASCRCDKHEFRTLPIREIQGHVKSRTGLVPARRSDHLTGASESGAVLLRELPSPGDTPGIRSTPPHGGDTSRGDLRAAQAANVCEWCELASYVNRGTCRRRNVACAFERIAASVG
jgi:hypothetical protein